jgi:Integrase core domain
MRGRTPGGREAVERLQGSMAAKQRLQVLLEVLCGRCRVLQACARLGVKAARWAQWRRRALHGALAALEPRPRGRRPCRRHETTEQVEALAARVRELELALRVAEARADVAEIRGGVVPALPRRSRGRSTRQAAVAEDEEAAGGGGVAKDAAEAEDTENAVHARAVGTAPSAVDGNGLLLRRAEKAVPRRRGHRGARGWSRQRPRRQAEAAVRERWAAIGVWARKQGWHLPVVAARLRVSERSLRRWSARQRCVVARGRPVIRPPLAVRQDVLVQLAESGPGVSVACLREAFPQVPRAELVDLRGRYRRLCRQRGRGRMARLTWTPAGVVWAADFAWPPEWIDGRYARLLSVRDLASGMQLAWRPVSGESAAETCQVLTGLFQEHGAPLVLKMDNGPAFRSDELERMLSPYGVLVLYSPAYTPS